MHGAWHECGSKWLGIDRVWKQVVHGSSVEAGGAWHECGSNWLGVDRVWKQVGAWCMDRVWKQVSKFTVQ